MRRSASLTVFSFIGSPFVRTPGNTQALQSVNGFSSARIRTACFARGTMWMTRPFTCRNFLGRRPTRKKPQSVDSHGLFDLPGTARDLLDCPDGGDEEDRKPLCSLRRVSTHEF